MKAALKTLVQVPQPLPQSTLLVANASAAVPTQARASFQCRWSDCQAAQMQRPTYGSQQHCFKCSRPKSSAMSPPAHSLVHWAKQEQHQQLAKMPSQKPNVYAQNGPAGSTATCTAAEKRAAKRQRQRTAKATARATSARGMQAQQLPQQAEAAGKEAPTATAAAVTGSKPDLRVQSPQQPQAQKTQATAWQSAPPPPPPPPTSPEQTTTAAKPRRSLKDILGPLVPTDAPELAPSLADVLTDLGKDMLPKELEDLPTAEATMLEHLKESGACTALAETAEKEERVAKLKMAVASLEGIDIPEIKDQLAANKALLQKEEAELAKKTKASPSPALELKGLRSAKSRFEEAAQKKEDRVEALAEAAAARQKKRNDKLTLMVQQLNAFRGRLAKEELALQELHKQRAEGRAAFQKQVVDLFQEKISALEKGGAGAESSGTSPPTVTGQVKSEQEARLQAELDQQQKTAQEAVAAAQAALADLEAKKHQVAKQVEELQAMASADQCARQATEVPDEFGDDDMDILVTVDESMLPTLPPPNEEIVPQLAYAWHVMEYCRLLPREVTLTYADLGVHATTLQAMLGQSALHETHRQS